MRQQIVLRMIKPTAIDKPGMIPLELVTYPDNESAVRIAELAMFFPYVFAKIDTRSYISDNVIMAQKFDWTACVVSRWHQVKYLRYVLLFHILRTSLLSTKYQWDND